MKRAFDLLLALVLLPTVLPLLVLAAIAVRLDTPGPAFFRQERVGLGGRPFMMIKIRTMAIGTKVGASHEIGAARVTRVGRFLRKSKMDELPQVLSVIAGDMSFVGPRPCLPMQIDLIAERKKRGAYAVRPGITGPAQIKGVDMSTPVKLAEIDAEYARNRTFLGDLRLFLATAFGAGWGDAAR